jgi:hypothetical protein
MLPSTVALAKVDGNILQEFSAQDSQKCSAQKSHFVFFGAFIGECPHANDSE